MSISNSDEYIAGTEVASEIERLNEEIKEKQDEIVEASNNGDTATAEELSGELDDLRLELKPLVELEEDIYYFALTDVNLIKETAFEDYSMRFAIDCGDVSEDSSVFAYIDWERYADGIQVDYTSVEFDGETYYHRS